MNRIAYVLINFFTLSMMLYPFSFSTLPSTQKIEQGIEYAQISPASSHEPTIHLLLINPHIISISIIQAHNGYSNMALVSELASQHKALGAINGSFFSSEGIPSGPLKINGAWSSVSSLHRAALGWKKDGSSTLIDRITTSCTATIDTRVLAIDGINQSPSSEKKIILYTPSHKETPSHNGGMEIVITNNIITELNARGGSTPVPHNGSILFIKNPDAEDFSSFKLGSSITITTKVNPDDQNMNALWNEFDFIVGGTPLLIKNKECITDFSPELILDSFVSESYARTAIGILPDGTWVIVVVDNNGIIRNNGMNLHNLASYLKELGCTEALNLCGGKSTTLVLHDKVRSSSFGPAALFTLKPERPVSDALLFHQKVIV